MNLSPRHEALAQALCAAYDGPALASEPWQGLLADAHQAYAVQERVARLRGCPAGRLALHWKSGGGSRSSLLTHAALAPSRVLDSPADLRGLRFHGAGIEPEIALRLGQAVTPEAAERLVPERAAGLVDAMAVAVEVVDSRWAEAGQAPALLRLADAQSHGAFVLGAWVPYVARDWAAQRCELQWGEEAPLQRTGTHPLGEPAWGLAEWLRHLTRAGATVPAGTIVTTGTWAGLVPVKGGERLRVAFEGVGAVELQF